MAQSLSVLAVGAYVVIGGLPGVGVALDLAYGNSTLSSLSGWALASLPAGTVMVVGLVGALVWQQYERLVSEGRANARLDLGRRD